MDCGVCAGRCILVENRPTGTGILGILNAVLCWVPHDVVKECSPVTQVYVDAGQFGFELLWQMLQVWIEALAHIREGGNSCGEKSEREMASTYVIQLSDFGLDIGHRFGVRKPPVVEATGQEEECLG